MGTRLNETALPRPLHCRGSFTLAPFFEVKPRGQKASKEREGDSGPMMATDRDSSPLPTSIVRGLTDKLVERRKGAALELER